MFRSLCTPARFVHNHVPTRLSAGKIWLARIGALVSAIRESPARVLELRYNARGIAAALAENGKRLQRYKPWPPAVGVLMRLCCLVNYLEREREREREPWRSHTKKIASNLDNTFRELISWFIVASNGSTIRLLESRFTCCHLVETLTSKVLCYVRGSYSIYVGRIPIYIMFLFTMVIRRLWSRDTLNKRNNIDTNKPDSFPVVFPLRFEMHVPMFVSKLSLLSVFNLIIKYDNLLDGTPESLRDHT